MKKCASWTWDLVAGVGCLVIIAGIWSAWAPAGMIALGLWIVLIGLAGAKTWAS